MDFRVSPAYSGSPNVAVVPRKAFALRMCQPCWEDSCWMCWGGECACACDGGTPRCRRCRRPVATIRHLAVCDPDALAARLRTLADSIGEAA